MRATITRDVDQKDIISAAVATSVTPSLLIRDDNMPQGDMLLRSLLIRYDATIGGTSTPTRVTNGHIFYANSITVESDKQKNVVDNVDGLLLYTMLAYENGTPGAATALTATPADTDTPSAAWEIPLTLQRGIRPYDTNLDMLRQKINVKTQYGPGTNLWTQAGGSPQVTAATQGIAAKVLPGPVQVVSDPANGLESELPIYARYFGQVMKEITTTENRKQIALTYGAYIFRRLFITQRNTSTKIEMSNVIAATARVSLEINNVPIVQNVRFRDLQAFNKGRYSLESLFTGVAVLDFDADDQEKIGDMLKTITKESGSIYLYVDATTQTNASILLGIDALREIDPSALR